MSGVAASNEDLARSLDAVADLLGVQHANVFRVRGWRHAAGIVRDADFPVAERIRTGSIAGIGVRLSSAIRELVATGRLRTLERLQGELNPEQVLLTVPGLGRELAHRIHEELGVSTLEELEDAAHDGRLAALDGFGKRRTLGVREVLGGMLGRAGRIATRAREHAGKLPVEVLLDVDAEYRRRVATGDLPTIAPHRFNPRHERWLPVLHTERAGHAFTALFSNTARAHELGMTRDWVALYWHAEDDPNEGRSTVVTETHGPLAGQRVVRGREHEPLQQGPRAAASAPGSSV